VRLKRGHGEELEIDAVRECAVPEALGGQSAGLVLFDRKVDRLVEAEGHAVGVGLAEVICAEGCGYLVEAVLAAARIELFPGNFSLVEQGLRGAVQCGCPLPVAQVAGDGSSGDHAGW